MESSSIAQAGLELIELKRTASDPQHYPALFSFLNLLADSDYRAELPGPVWLPSRDKDTHTQAWQHGSSTV